MKKQDFDLDSFSQDIDLRLPLLTNNLVSYYFKTIETYPRAEFVLDIFHELTSALEKQDRELFYSLMCLFLSEYQDLVNDHSCPHDILLKAVSSRLLYNNV